MRYSIKLMDGARSLIKPGRNFESDNDYGWDDGMQIDQSNSRVDMMSQREQRPKRMNGHFRTAMLVVFTVVLVASSLFVTGRAEARWSQAGANTCSTSGCHPSSGITWQTAPTISVAARNITAGQTATIPYAGAISANPGDQIEIDWRYTGFNLVPYNNAVIWVPDGWTVGQGTTATSGVPGWITAWDLTSSNYAGSVAPVWTARATEWVAPGTLTTPSSGFHLDFAGTVWDGASANNKGSNLARDDGNITFDKDGAANSMGTDARVTIPAGATPGTYHIHVYGAGKASNSGGQATKGSILQIVQVTVTAGGDTIKPTVTSSSPVKSATGVAKNSVVTINFSENIDCTTVNTTNVTMSTGGWTFGSCNGSTATFNTSGQTDLTAYTVTVTTAVQDVAGNALDPANTLNVIDYTTGDTTPPTISSTFPTNGATGVALDGLVNIVFNENINCATANTTNITSDSPGWSLASCGGTTASFNTLGQANGTLYNVNVTTNVTDTAGNPLASPYPFSFTTVASANQPPTDPLNLAQFFLDGVTPIAIGGFTTEAQVVFNSNITDPNGADTVKLQIDTDSNGIFDCESALVAQAVNYQLTCAVADGSYNWQARTVDNLGAVSNWMPFNVANPDFIKDATAPVDGTLTATPGDTQVVLNWTAATDAHSGLTSPAYAVAKLAGGTPPADCFTPLTTTDLLTYTDNAVANGSTYSYRICATNSAGLQSAGTVDSATPSAGCAYTDPTVTILTASKDITTDGGFTDYTVQVTNNDTAICGNATYNLSLSDTNSTNFYASLLAQNSLANVAPGTSAQTTFRVSALANQPNSVTNNSDVTTALDANHAAVTSTAITTTINVSAGGCEAEGDYLLSNGDRLSTSR